MSSTPLHAVTGAFGYSGKYIARRLLDSGQRVITLTNSIDRANAFGGQIPAHPFNFDRPDDLVRRSLASRCSTTLTGCASTIRSSPTPMPCATR